MGFSNPIMGGGGALVYPAIKSPNYAPASAGWSINKDGTVEFNDGTFRGTIAASIFEGTDFEINASGAFFYSGTPAPGNLIASQAAAGGTDAHGNAYLNGTVSYEQLAPGSWLAVQQSGGAITFQTATGYAGPWTAGGVIGPGTDSIELAYPSGGSVYLAAPVQKITALQPGTTGTVETWHPITLDTGWATVSGYAAPQYRMTPAGDLQLAGIADFGSSTTANHNLNGAAPLPAAYRPASIKLFRANTGPGGRGAVQINSAGVIEMLANASYPAQYCEIDAVLSLL